MPGIASAIERALLRNVRVVFVLETAREDGGKVEFDPSTHLKALADTQGEIYRWPAESRLQDERGRFGSLHAKFAVADRERLFISSANLTEHAFNLNIELGVVLTGGTAPAQAAMHVDGLIRDGILCRVKPQVHVGNI